MIQIWSLSSSVKRFLLARFLINLCSDWSELTQIRAIHIMSSSSNHVHVYIMIDLAGNCFNNIVRKTSQFHLFSQLMNYAISITEIWVSYYRSSSILSQVIEFFQHVFWIEVSPQHSAWFRSFSHQSLSQADHVQVFICSDVMSSHICH